MRLALSFFAVVLVMLPAAWIGDVQPAKLKDLPQMWNYFKELIPGLHAAQMGHDLQEWYWNINLWLSELLDTVLIAVLSTLIAVVFAFLMCFPASRNLMKRYWVYFVFRRTLEIARGVPELLYAMVFVFAFNLGPMPGVLAIALHSIGSLGKLFSEVNENIDTAPLDGIRSTGGNWFQAVRFGVIPQVLPNFISYALLRLEINIRAASIIGLVGAGGIGQQLMLSIRQFQYTDISAIVILIVTIVVILDTVCEKIRHSVIGKEEETHE